MSNSSSTLKKKLKEYGKLWRKTKAAPPMGGDLPDGNYIGKCISLTVNTSKASDRLQVSEKWKIVKPTKHKGRYLFAHIGLEGKNDEETQTAMSFAKQRYEEVMGATLPEDDLTEMQDAFDSLVDKEADTRWKLSAKTKNDFQNLFVNGVSDGETVDDNDDDDDKKKSDDDDDDDKKKSDDDDDDDDKKKKSDDDDDEEEYQRERRRKREKEKERSRR